MKVSELISKLQPFAKDELADEPLVLIATDPNRRIPIMPEAPDTVRVWEANGVAYVLIFTQSK